MTVTNIHAYSLDPHAIGISDYIRCGSQMATIDWKGKGIETRVFLAFKYQLFLGVHYE